MNSRRDVAFETWGDNHAGPAFEDSRDLGRAQRALMDAGCRRTHESRVALLPAALLAVRRRPIAWEKARPLTDSDQCQAFIPTRIAARFVEAAPDGRVSPNPQNYCYG